MSFYLDDDEWRPGVGLSQTTLASAASGQQHGGDEFICDNCGGMESYMDDTTGVLTCAECFTQSQTMLAASQEEVDFDDAMALAGRFSTGQLAVAQGPAKAKKRRLSRPLPEWDQSSSLPTAQDCIRGMQRILRESHLIICDVLNCKEADSKQVMTSIRTMWSAYLRSWMEGADHFGAFYPEIRFCFRDHFLSVMVRSRILKNLSFKVTQRIRKEVQRQGSKEPKQEESSEADDERRRESSDVSYAADSYTTEDVDERGVKEEDSLPFEVMPEEDDDDELSQTSDITVEKVARHNRTKKEGMTPFATVISHYYKCLKKRKIGRRAAALMLAPSMTMVAAILCIAFSPLGIMPYQIQEWIGNGTLPLLDAFQLLTPNEAKVLNAVRGFFRFQQPPSIGIMKKTIALLHVACGYQPRKIVVKKSGQEKPDKKKSTSKFLPGRIITPSSVPLVLARLVSDLKLSQRVLNFSLAIMGLPVAHTDEIPEGSKGPETHWLPLPLNKARADRLSEIAHILGVIVVACKFIPNWEKHWYVRPPSNHSNTTFDKVANGNGFVPWTEHEITNLRNGQQLEDYLEFAEGYVMNTSSPELPKYVATLNCGKAKARSTRVPPADSIHPNELILHARIPKLRNAGRKRKATALYEVTERADIKLVRPLAEPLGPFIDFIALKTRTSPSEIVSFVADLDRELKLRRQRPRFAYLDPQAAYIKLQTRFS